MAKMDTVPIFIIIIMAPLLLPCMSERNNFPVPNLATWDEAREHCQRCYEELVTVTYSNILELVGSVTQKHWIGLRQNLAADPWSCWANGDPLIFQNWYPGGRQSAATTTLAPTTTTTTTTAAATTAPEVSTDHSYTPWTNFYNSETPRTTTYPHEAVKEDCVAMLHSGLWVEIDCTLLLPYICFEERFVGNASFNRTTTNATLRWLPAPGNISSYTVVLRGGINMTTNVTGLTYDLGGLIPGTLYDARVYPVKCGRELNPQSASFYTNPLAVQNLVASNITESSVVLSWERPAEGGLHSYRVEVRGGRSDCTLAEWAEVTGLIPGGRYTMDVFCVVEDESAKSEAANLTLFTKPYKVTNVIISDVTNQSLILKWTHKGNATGYHVVANPNISSSSSNNPVDASKRNLKVEEIPAGIYLCLTVTARANELEGDGDTACSFIIPNPVASLKLTASQDSINASWPSPGAYEFFSVSVQLVGGSVNDTPRISTTNTTLVTLSDLYAAANYTVTVTTVAGSFRSKPATANCLTKTVMPTGATISGNKTHATLEWTTPGAAVTTVYLVTFNSSFWGEDYDFSVSDGSNQLAVDGLKPGTRYVFKVYTMSGEQKSDPACVEYCTEWDRSDITLSMMCSSAQMLQCDIDTVQSEILTMLEKHFGGVLHGVKWSLKWKNK